MCQARGDPNFADTICDVLIKDGIDGTRDSFLYAHYEGFARSQAAQVGIPFNNAATIEMGLSIIMQRWCTRKVHSGTLDLQSFVSFMFQSKTMPLEQKANNTSRLLV